MRKNVVAGVMIAIMVIWTPVIVKASMRPSVMTRVRLVGIDAGKVVLA